MAGLRGLVAPRAASRPALLIAVLAALVPLSGCDSGGRGGPSGPTALEVQLSSDAVQVTRAVTATAVDIGRRDRFEVAWSVDGVVGGTGSAGTITQTNPATYTAPASVPQGGSVVIEARLGSDASVSASDTLAVLFTVLHVDAGHGDDGSGTGTWAAPLKTVTQALAAVTDGDTVLVRPGTHDIALGESPPYEIPPNVTLRGAHRDSCVLFGGGDEGNVIVLGDGGTVERLTIRNADRDVTAIYASESGWIRWIRITEPFLFAGIRCANGSDALIEDCHFESTQERSSGRGFELIEDCHATVRRCTLRGWSEAMFVSGTSDPRIEYCVLENNRYGLDTWESDDQTKPDLGGGERGSLGGNVIRGNASCGLANRTPATIFAINNTWNVAPVDPPVYCSSVGDSCDICVTGTGTVLWCECAPE